MYSKLPFEPKSIKSYREKAQKKYAKDEFLGFILMRPFSIYISVLLYKFTKVSANAVTFVMFALSLLVPLYLITIGDNSFFYLFILCYFGVWFLDLVDGELARLRGVLSKFGYFLDIGLWFTFPLWHILFYFKLHQLNIIDEISAWTLISLEFAFLFVTVIDWMRAGAAKSLYGLHDPNEQKEAKIKEFSFLYRLFYILPQKPILFLMAPIYVFLGWPIFILGFKLHIIGIFLVYLLLTCKKIYMFKRYFSDD